MKKTLFAIALAFVASLSTMNAQNNLTNVLSKVAEVAKASQSSKTATTANSLSSLFSNLVGTSKVSSSSIVGTWVYAKPAVAFESSNLLSKAGGAVAATTIQNKMANALTKYGIKGGISSFTFNSDGTFSALLNKKTVKGKYTLSGSTVSFTTMAGTKLGTANVSIKSNALQMTFKADKLLTFIQGASALSAASSTLSTISALSKNYSGMQLGLQFTKK